MTPSRDYSGVLWTYRRRLASRVGPPLFTAALWIVSLSLSPWRGNLMLWVMVSVLFVVILLVSWKRATHHVYAVRFIDDMLVLFGQTFSISWEKRFAISEIQAGVTQKGRRRIRYLILELKTHDTRFTLNEYGNWGNQDVADVFELLRTTQQKKITVDEKIILRHTCERV